MSHHDIIVSSTMFVNFVHACVCACVLGCMCVWVCTFTHVCAIEKPASTAVITVTCVLSTSAHIAHHLCKVAARPSFSLVFMLLMFEHKSVAQSPISCHIRQERIASLGSLLALLDKTLQIRLSMQQVSRDQHKLTWSTCGKHTSCGAMVDLGPEHYLACKLFCPYSFHHTGRGDNKGPPLGPQNFSCIGM